MAGAHNTFETGLASGTILTGNNSGGSAGAAFGANLYQASGATITYSDSAMHGAMAGRIELASSGGASMGFAPPAGQQVAWTRGYFYYASTPNANTLIHFVRDGAVTNSGFGARVTTGGELQLREHVGYTTLAAATLSPDTWYRLEVYAHTNGAWSVWLYVGDSEVPELDNSGSVGMTAASQFNTVRWGAEGSSLTAAWTLDDLAWSDEGRLGVPIIESKLPTRYIFDGSIWVPVSRRIKS